MPAAPDPASRPQVYLDITVNGGNAGRLQFELYNDIAPKAAENFRGLCTGDRGYGLNGKKLHLKGSRFYRILPGAYLCGGDIINGDGTGGESVYGEPFKDDRTKLKHLGMGILSTSVDTAENQNDSRFNITLANVDWIDSKCVVFGKMTHGRTCLLEMEQAGTEYTGEVGREVKIVDCGELKNERVLLNYGR